MVRPTFGCLDVWNIYFVAYKLLEKKATVVNAFWLPLRLTEEEDSIYTFFHSLSCVSQYGPLF